MALVLSAGHARADVPAPPQGPGGAAYGECIGKDIGGTCQAGDGSAGTCIVVRGGPFGKPWDRLVCLSHPEAVRGRREGWVAVGVALLLALATAGIVRRQSQVRSAGQVF
jgi:hypothetical protein